MPAKLKSAVVSFKMTLMKEEISRIFQSCLFAFQECYGTIKTAGVVADSVLTDIFRDLENIYLLDSRFLQELEERMATW